MSGEVLALVSAIKERLIQWMPELNAVDYHGGRFSLQDVQAYATKTPAVFVSVQSIPAAPIACEESEGELDVVVFILTRDVPGLSRYESALAIAEYLCDAVPNKNFGYANAYPAEQVQGRNLHTSELGRQGVTLWAVAWKQMLRFRRPPVILPLSRHLYFSGPVALEVHSETDPA